MADGYGKPNSHIERIGRCPAITQMNGAFMTFLNRSMGIGRASATGRAGRRRIEVPLKIKNPQYPV
jgi:hypothetical protein